MTLAEAGIDSAPVDALLLAAHLLGQEPREVRRLMVLGGTLAPPGYDDLVAERATRVPLQHLTGRAAFRHLELAVGPGVFVPRPETELLVGLALARPGRPAAATAARRRRPGDRVRRHRAQRQAGVPRRDRLRRRAERARARLGGCQPRPAGTGRRPSATATPGRRTPSWTGTVDVVTCNPPYIPVGDVPRDPEVRDYDPELALYGGSADGLALPVQLGARAAQLLHPGGILVMEHAETQGASLPRALMLTEQWGSVIDHVDLLGRPRCVVAVRA